MMPPQMSPAELEGGEVIKSKEGNAVELEAPDHEEGGMDLDLPVGTFVFSKKLKGPDGKSMAAREKIRTNRENKVIKALEKNPTDPTNRFTFNRVLDLNETERQQDMMIQGLAELIDNYGKKGGSQVVSQIAETTGGYSPAMGDQDQMAMQEQMAMEEQMAQGQQGMMPDQQASPSPEEEAMMAQGQQQQAATPDMFPEGGGSPEQMSQEQMMRWGGMVRPMRKQYRTGTPGTGIADVAANLFGTLAQGIPTMEQLTGIAGPILNQQAGTAATTPAAPAATTTTPAATPPVARPGMNKAGKPEIYDLQQELIRQGAKIKADGIAGPQTAKATQQFYKPVEALPTTPLPKSLSPESPLRPNYVGKQDKTANALSAYLNPASVAAIQGAAVNQGTTTPAGTTTTPAATDGTTTTPAATDGTATTPAGTGTQPTPELKEKDDKGLKFAAWVAKFAPKLGPIGAGVASLAPLAVTIANRLGDKKVPNFYDDYGRAGLEANTASMRGAASERALANRNVALQSASAMAAARGSSRGVNTLRGLSQGVAAQAGQQRAQTSNQYQQQMSQLMDRRAGLLNERDKVVAEARTRVFDENEKQRDQFFTNLATNVVGVGKGMQFLGGLAGADAATKTNAFLSQVAGLFKKPD